MISMMEAEVGIEEAVRGQLEALPGAVAGSAVARSALDLARRLDTDPADTSAVLLHRELRMAMAELRLMAKDDVDRGLEEFLGRISTPAFGDGSH